MRQGRQLGSCWLLSLHSALDVAVGARSQPGHGPRLPWREETGSGLQVMHQSTPE